MLLHLCCAPCSVYVLEKLSKDYDVVGFFYNPNIQPEKEYQFRKRELEKIANKKDWNIFYSDDDIKEWFEAVREFRWEPERGKRCSICFTLRLRKTFKQAKKYDFKVVASTLSISPYKNTRQINEVGMSLSREFCIEFLPENFKKKDGYQIGEKMAHEQGIKHQDYCGCVYSKVEQILRKRSKY